MIKTRGRPGQSSTSTAAIRRRSWFSQHPAVLVGVGFSIVVLIAYVQRHGRLSALDQGILNSSKEGGIPMFTFNNTRPDVCLVKSPQPLVDSFRPEEPSLSGHRTPSWFKSARFGIFIHWGLYSVPGWAETKHSFEQFNKGVSPEEHFRHNPYAEWYLNTVRLKGSEAQRYHYDTYNEDPELVHPSQWYYDKFSKLFDQSLEKWNPNSWAKTFAKSGAGYVVLTTKHHDGYTLWPSKVHHPLWSKWAGKQGSPRHPSKRDLVGELTTAVHAHGLQMGLYYSGGLDWSFKWEIDDCFDDPSKKAKCHPGVPNSAQYAEYAGDHLQELITKYRPAILWDDINWPSPGKSASFGKLSLPQLFAQYFNKACPAGLINDRWHLNRGTKPWKWTGDIGTPEYSQMEKVQGNVYEVCRGIGKSFGFNRVEEESDDCKAYMTVRQTLHLLISTVAKNGNLLLDVGPDQYGRIPECQVAVLAGVGKWLNTYGSALMDAIPYALTGSIIKPEDPVRYMQSSDKSTVYAIILGGRVQRATSTSQTLQLFKKDAVPHLHINHNNRADIIWPGGVSRAVIVQQNDNDLSVFIPWAIVPSSGVDPWVIRFFASRTSQIPLDCREVGSCTAFA